MSFQEIKEDGILLGYVVFKGRRLKSFRPMPGIRRKSLVEAYKRTLPSLVDIV